MDNQLFRYTSTGNGFQYSHTVSDPPQDPNILIHDYYELYYFISGDVTYSIEGQNYELKPHDILVVNSKELHKPIFDSNARHERIVFHFKPNALAPFMSDAYPLLQSFENRRLGYCNRLKGETVLLEGIHKYIARIESYIKEDALEKDIMIRTLFIQMLVAVNNIYMQQCVIGNESEEYDEKITSILEYITDHLDEKITLEILEGMFYINRYYLCHIFKKKTTFTVMEYITYKRIMKAKDLLLEGMPITEVCNTIGFNDYSNFYKVFKRLVGSSPKDFAKENMPTH